MNMACKTACVERNVAHLILPDEVQTKPSQAEAGGPLGRAASRQVSPPEEALAAAVEMIRRAERPMITVRPLAAGVGADHGCTALRAEIAERWAIWRAEKASRRTDDNGLGLNAASLFAALGRHIDDDAVICVDVGSNTCSFGRYFEVGYQDVLTSGSLGSIGFGQYAMEMTAAVKHDMNITHVLMNNFEPGKISKEQRAASFDVWQTDALLV
jgi:thiamine pyrophosphate-dependent acetolactate synthase large subunit-like protein